MRTIAVIGGGAAGIGAARRLLGEGFQVILVEAAPRLGGNCVGLEIPDGRGGRHTIDVGVSDFNRVTFTHVARLIEELGLPTQPIRNDAHFASPAGESLWACQGGEWRFCHPIENADGLAAEIAEFRTRALEVLHDERFADWTVERYLDHVGVSPAFRHGYFYPRAIGCFPMPAGAPGGYSIRSLVRFWNLHGVVSDRPGDRRCVVGGMHRYPRAFERWFAGRGGQLLCRTRVLGIVRSPSGVEVRTVDHTDRHRRLRVDQVVLANHAHDALPLLEDATGNERKILGGFPYQRARLVVHRDERLMGSDRGLWGAFHYVVPAGGLPRVRPTITFFPNELGSLPDEVPEVFVTMNPHLEPRPESVLADRFFLHPVGNVATRRAGARIDVLQGVRRTWYAGGYLRSPFVHESALRSGIEAAERVIGAVRDVRRVVRGPSASRSA